MKKILILLSVLLCGLIILLLVFSNMKSADYAEFTHVDSVVQSDAKYVMYLYSEEDTNSSNLLSDVKNFNALLKENEVPFYAISMDEKSNRDFYSSSTEQSGVDYPVTPDQVNELGLDNFVIGGTPTMLFVDGGQAKRIGVGVQTSSMGNSYISVQDTMASIAEDLGTEFTANYTYSD